MNVKSSYKDNYKNPTRAASRREAPIKREDNLRVSNSIMFNGQSSYDHDYHRYKNFNQERDSFAPH